MLSTSNAEMLIHAFMTSRLDYCNALLGGCCARLINKLQMVQNAAARDLTRTRKYDHISPVLSTLHWLPITFTFTFSRRFYPKRLTLHSSYSFYILSALAFPGNRTHDIGVANAMLYQLSYRKAIKHRTDLKI